VLTIVERAHSKLGLRSNSRAVAGEPYMALHLRRGDFEDHCRGLASSHGGFTTWATLPLLTDSIFPPALDFYEPDINIRALLPNVVANFSVHHCIGTLNSPGG